MNIMQGDTVMRNPLCARNLPYHLPDFPAIRPEHVLPALDQLLETYRQGVEEYIAARSKPDWSIVEKEIDAIIGGAPA